MLQQPKIFSVHLELVVAAGKLPTPGGSRCPSTVSPPSGTTRGSGNGRGAYMRIPSRATACKYSRLAAEVALIWSYELKVDCISLITTSITLGFLSR